MIHELKTWPEYFEEVLMAHKNFEVRKHDRNYQVGDTLILKEYDPTNGTYTGRELARGISYILPGGDFGIEKGFCVMSLS